MLTPRPQRRGLHKHHKQLEQCHLGEPFADDSARGLRATDETPRPLVELARACKLNERTEAMFRGQVINVTEKRAAALHVALRAPEHAELVVDGENVVLAVYAVLKRMTVFAEHMRSGAWKGYTGQHTR